MFVFHFAIIQNYKDTFQANDKKKKSNWKISSCESMAQTKCYISNMLANEIKVNSLCKHTWMRMQVHSFSVLFAISLSLFPIFANPNLSFYFRCIQQLQAGLHWFMFCNYRWIWQQNAFSSCFKFLVNVGKRIEFVCSRRKINSFINVNGNALSNQMAKYLSHWNVNCVVSQLVRYTFVGIVECDAKIIKSSRIMNNERMCIRCYSERIRARPTGIAQIGMRRAWAKRET